MTSEDDESWFKRLIDSAKEIEYFAIKSPNSGFRSYFYSIITLLLVSVLSVFVIFLIVKIVNSLPKEYVWIGWVFAVLIVTANIVLFYKSIPEKLHK